VEGKNVKVKFILEDQGGILILFKKGNKNDLKLGEKAL